MQLIRCTGKLQKEMGLKKSDLCEAIPKFSYLGSWHANLIFIDRCSWLDERPYFPLQITHPECRWCS